MIDLINKLLLPCSFLLYYKELKKLVSCLYGVIICTRWQCWENTREACKTLGYASCFTSFSRILPTFLHRALLHHKGTRHVFQFLSNLPRIFLLIYYFTVLSACNVVYKKRNYICRHCLLAQVRASNAGIF